MTDMEGGVDEADTNYNVFVGTENGILKGVYFGKEAPRLKNFHSFETIKETAAISTLAWTDDTQKELLVAFENDSVKVYNTKLRSFTQGIQINPGDGRVVGVEAYTNKYVVGHESGKVSLWSFLEDKYTTQIDTGKHLSKIGQCLSEKNIFATGGKENDLKIWNLNSTDPTVPIFKAKNIPHDFLDLRVPVWVQDLTFMPQSSELVGLCSRYGHVRFYDPKADNKGRPVINMEFMDHALMSISATSNNRQVVVGSSRGKMGLIDLRNPGKGKVVHHYTGPTGSIRSISAHPDLPYFVSCGLNRHLYLHHLHEKQPIKKLFLKSRLNCVKMTNAFNLDDIRTNEADDAPGVWDNISMEVLNTTPISVKPQTRKKRKLSDGC